MKIHSRAPAALSLFQNAGLEVNTSVMPWRIGEYLYWPESSRWRSVDGKREGYEPGRLIAEIAIRTHNPAALAAVELALSDAMGADDA